MNSGVGVGYVGLVIVLIALVVLNLRFLKRWLRIVKAKGEPTEQDMVLPGPVGWIVIGTIALSIGINEKLVAGNPWHLGLISLSLSHGKEGLSFSLLGYALIALGMVQIFLRRK